MKISVPSRISFIVQEGEEETAENLIDRIRDGCPPTWLEELIRDGLVIEEAEVEDITIRGRAPDSEEELDFSY